MTPEEAKTLAMARLSAERFYHTACVASAAGALAERHGADVREALVAAWLHDILKEERPEDLLQRIKRSDIINASQIARMPSVWHAYAGGLYVGRELCLSGDIANAVMYHTTGRAGMSKLEKVILLADYTSADREFSGVEEVRELAQTSLDEACAVALRNGIIHLCKKRKLIDLNSVLAFNELIIQK